MGELAGHPVGCSVALAAESQVADGLTRSGENSRLFFLAFRLTARTNPERLSATQMQRGVGDMSTVSKLSDVGTKVRVGAAACAMAGTAVLAPGAVAYASPAGSMPTAGLGSSVDALCDEADTECLSPFASASANAVPVNPLIQNDFWWFGPIPDPAPENIAVFEYNIIPLFTPEIQAAAYSWWASVIPNGFNACILGATAKVDSYSTLSVGFTKGCSG